MSGAALPRPARVATELYLEVVQFYAYEARLLDNGEFEQWLNLLTDDVQYWLPVPVRRFRRDAAEPQPGQTDVFNEYKPHLALRVRRLHSQALWGEDPKNAIRHHVSNVEVEALDSGEWLARSNLLVHRARLDGETRSFSAGRADRLRRVKGDLCIADRRITLDHGVIADTNLNFFF